MTKETLQKNNMFACGNFNIELGGKTRIMGILNITPDSFSDGGKFFDREKALKRALEIEREGADILDIGGESTRPGSMPVSAALETRRVLPVIKELSRVIKIPISIDTHKHEVADAALSVGASMVNDISGLKNDREMAKVVSMTNAGLCLMHKKGAPIDMQEEPYYYDVVSEVSESLKESIFLAEQAGIREDRIVIDPGIGFGKTTEHNLALLNRLKEFTKLGKPIMIGVSRKSFIGNITGRKVTDRIAGTLAATCMAMLNGAALVRAHDVRLTREAADVIDALKSEKYAL